ncbi:MAG: L-type lectin-domain containing protein [Actinomycetota bacterium]|nr:L-type lectin-domain containing protein [Actinomycetota bacterium]
MLGKELRALKWSCAAVALAVLGLAASANSAVIADFPDFSDVSKLKLNGDAEQSGDLLRLTSADSDETGTAFTKKAVLNKKKSFKTEFNFSMHDSSTSPGDGMAFVIHSSGKSVVGDGGGGLGFGSIGDSVAVEFDTFDNGGGDEQANEVAIIQNGKAGKTKDASVPSFSLYGGPRWAWITYKAKSQRLKVYVSDTSTKPGSPEVQANVKLDKVLNHGRDKRAGFTAATGGSNEVHDVISWKLTQ